MTKKIVRGTKHPEKIDFDISVVNGLNKNDLITFRNNFLKIICDLRAQKINIDYDSIRLQSIKYNTFLIGPQTISLKISGVCNYRCRFCGTHNPVPKLRTKFFSDDFMPFRDIKKIGEVLRRVAL